MSITDAQNRAAMLRQRMVSPPPGGENRKLTSLIKISQSLAAPMTFDELTGAVVREVCGLLKADQVFLLLRDAAGKLHVRSEYSALGAPNRHYVSLSICEETANGLAVLIPEALSDLRFQTKESVVALNLRSVMAAPVTAGGQTAPTGVLYVCSYTTGELFGESDLELLKAFAAQVGIHLDRTRVLAEKDRLLGELAAVAASRGRVVEVANHELKTPMQQVWLGLAVAQKMLEGDAPVDKEKLMEPLQTAIKGVQRMKDHFVDPLRAYYDLELLLGRLNFEILLPETVELLLARWRTLSADHILNIFDRLPVSIRVDQPLFERAITHLLQNAIAYSPAGSTIIITAIRLKDDLVITITDQGIGIPPADLPHITTWLYRGGNVANKANFPAGFGAGLYEVRRIIEAHGGRLTIESELGKGTRAAVSLPALVQRD